MMLSWIFKPKQATVNTLLIDKEPAVSDGFTAPQSPHKLLNTPRRQKLLAFIWQRTSVSKQQFDLFYRKPIERYAALVQQFPASESHHHAYAGGMLDHGLEIVAYALKLRQSYLLPIGSTPEEQASQEQIWSAGIAYAALLHDIGKIAVDLAVEYENGQAWHPWHGVLTQPYRFKYRTNRQYRLHSASSGLLYRQILDTPSLDWLCQTDELWASLLYILAGQIERAGVIGDIVTKADQASVAQELGGDPIKAMSAPKQALQRKLLDGLRYLIKEELNLNNAGPSDGWLTDDGVWLVSKTVSDKLRAHLLSQGISGIPSKNSVIFDIMQEHSLLLTNDDDKAIWNATVTCRESGWSNKFTFLKISPALIWDTADRPASFKGAVVVDMEEKTPAMPETKDEGTIIHTVEPDSLSIKEATFPVTDSLDAVLDLLGMDDEYLALPVDTDHSSSLEAVNTPIMPEFPSIEHSDLSRMTTNPIESKKNKKQQEAKTALLVEPSMPIIVSSPTDSVVKAIAVDSASLQCQDFIEWLKQAILNQKLIINEPHALVHTVEDTIYIVTPGIFMRYASEFPQIQRLSKEQNIASWRYAQKNFERLKVHRKQPNGLNIWTCSVEGPKSVKKVHGYLFIEPSQLIPDILYNNPYLKLISDTDSCQS